jgi:hypothetical protein
MRDREGREASPAEFINSDSYNSDARTLRVKLSASHLSKLEDDYRVSRVVNSLVPELRMAYDFVTSDETSPGEKLLAVATPPARAVGKVASGVGRPFQAGTAGFWAGVRGEGAHAFKTAYDTETTGVTPPEGENVVGEAARGSKTLADINPRLPALVGGAADLILDPANLLPLGAGRVVGKLAAAGEEAGALGRAASKLRDAGLYTPAREAAAFKATDDTRIFGDLARRIDTPTALSELPDIPVNESFREPRVVKGAMGEARRPVVADGREVPRVPEVPETLAAQMETLIKGRRRAVVITPGETMPELPRGHVATPTEKGTFIHDPHVVTSAEVGRRVAEGTHGELLGHVTRGDAITDRLVVARDPHTGVELQASYVTPETVEAQAAELRRQIP